MSGVLEVFQCVPLEVKITREACGARHARSKAELDKRGRQGQSHLVGNQRCADCPVGAAHRAGERPEAWPDGDAIELGSLTAPKPGRSRWTGGEDVQRGALPGGGGGRSDREAGAASGGLAGSPASGATAGTSRGSGRGHAPDHRRAQSEDAPGEEPGRGERASTTTRGKTMATKQTCPECNSAFTKKHPRQKYCDKECGKAAADRRKREAQKAKRKSRARQGGRAKLDAKCEDCDKPMDSRWKWCPACGCEYTVEGGGIAPPGAKPKPPKAGSAIVVDSGDGIDAALATIEHVVEKAKRELVAAQMTGNVLARMHGRPLPYPELEASS